MSAIKRGNARTYDITVTNSDGTPKNITGYTFTMAVKKKQGMTNADAEFVATGSIVSAAAGTARISVTSSQFDIPAGVYYADIKTVYSGEVQNSTTFTIEIVEAITL